MKKRVRLQPPGRRATQLAQALVDRLPDSSQSAALFNPYRDRCRHDEASILKPAVQRLTRLAHHLDRGPKGPKLILVGEAIGYQGGRYSGIAFTSERLMMEGSIPGISKLEHRLTDRKLPFSEPSASIVWGTLHALGLAEQTVLWNALHCHPHKPDKLWSNRTPTTREIDLGAEALLHLLKEFPDAQPVAVGQKAGALLNKLMSGGGGNKPRIRPDIPSVRHPAYGGANEFRKGLAELFGQSSAD